MIEKASFTNFKSLHRVDVELGRFMVIVGPNGSGKTSILDGLHYLAQATRKPLAAILRNGLDPSNLKSRGATEPMRLALSGRVGDAGAGFDAAIVIRGAAARPGDWIGTLSRRWGDVDEQTEENSLGVQRSSRAQVPLLSEMDETARRLANRDDPSPEMMALAGELGSARKLRLDVEKLASPSYSREETPRLDDNGSGLSSVLADMAGRSPELLQSITEAARKIVPALDRIRTRRAKVQEVEHQAIVIDEEPISHAVRRDYWGQQLLLDFKGAPDVLAPLASEGTLLAIGLLTALWTEPRPHLLLLDDIDKALHPSAQGELVAQLRKVLEMDPELQIIATSHSPYMLDHFDAADVLVTALRPDGSTACAPLTAHPDFDRWKSTTQPGELWSFLGDEWVTQQASLDPAAE